LVVLVGVEILPHGGWKDMFIPFIPATIDDFCERRIIICALNFYIACRLLARLWPIGWPGKRVIIVEVDRFGGIGFGGRRRFGGIVEEDAVIGSQRMINDEVVEVVMLGNG